ncbi:MAG: YhcN/YlaJ family sporulation lipoprotein [Clostridia bacterium]
MRKKYHQIIMLLIGLCMLTFFIIGCTRGNRNVQQPNQNNPAGQGQTFPGGNAPGTDGITNPGIGNNLGTDINRLNQPEDVRFNNMTNTDTDNTGIGNNQGNQTGFDKKRADNIRNQLSNSIGTAPTNVIVNGNTALIGYTPTDTSRDANAMRDTITNRVKQIDSTITNVVVSDSADMMTRINQLSNDITDGTRNNINNGMNDLNTRFNQLIQGTNNPNR